MSDRRLDVDSGKGVWARYAEGTAGREPMKFFDIAVATTAGDDGQGRLALDLGCGAGNETLAFLEHDWRVHAVDAEPRAVEILNSRVTEEQRERLETTVGRFSEVELPEADLVFASLSLPFTGDEFEESLRRAVTWVRPGGWLVAVFLGPDDSWAGEDDVTVVDREQLETALGDLDEVIIEEEQFDGPSGSGPKHWHWFIVRAMRSPG